MLVSSCGKSMMIGMQSCKDEWRLCHALPRKVICAVLVCIVALSTGQLLTLNSAQSTLLIVLGAAVLTTLALLAFTHLAGVFSQILGKSGAGFVILDVNRKSITSYTGHLFGTKRRRFSFDEVAEVSNFRQRWDDQSLSSGVVIRMYSGDNVVVPEHLDSLEIIVLAHFIGLKSSSMEIRPA